MVYHSSLNGTETEVACGCAILPLKTSIRGPAESAAEGEEDIVDETLGYFKANVLFKHFEVKGAADRTLIYLTLYTTQCLKRLETCPTQTDGVKALTALAHEAFSAPGEPRFALASFFPAGASPAELDLCRAYLKQAREELGRRLALKVYGDNGPPSKLWIAFSKRKFMNKAL
mmetsp:Transcript_33302/g.110132  ORF Transcript_33302/g.110132 Transcript_33302/m.110132 type:complete len:173 (+) Transcript_33302:69-587(+)